MLCLSSIKNSTLTARLIGIIIKKLFYDIFTCKDFHTNKSLHVRIKIKPNKKEQHMEHNKRWLRLKEPQVNKGGNAW